ncbi:uncharacterized protein HKW66_Vig0129470 [Vigna angularis]|nr:uncharacterized protein HKW66_Vig0129470 [Vigna angularis]
MVTCLLDPLPVGHRCLLETTQAVEELTSLPNMCSAIDTTPVNLRSTPKSNPNLNPYRCRYGYPSLFLQVVSDHKIFWDVCVKAPNGTNNATHFRDSLLYRPLLPFLLFLISPNGMGTPAQNLFDEMLMKGRSVWGSV